MKAFIMTTLSGNKGRIASFTAALVVASIIRLTLKYNMTLTPEMENTISIGVIGFVGWIIDAIALQINAKGIKQIQDALPPSVVSDGYAGDKTIEAVQDATSNTTK
jgi:hypothetical protein